MALAKTVGLVVGIVVLLIGAMFAGFLLGTSSDAPREIIREVEVPGPERIVEVEVPGPERIVEVEVPGPERIVEVIREVEVPAVVKENDLLVRGETTSINVFGWFTVVGEVFNNGITIATFVQVTATFYGVDMDVLCLRTTYSQPEDINPGDSAPFTVSCADENLAASITSFKIVASV